MDDIQHPLIYLLLQVMIIDINFHRYLVYGPPLLQVLALSNLKDEVFTLMRNLTKYHI